MGSARTLVVRSIVSAAAVWLWWWGIQHWPRLSEPYGPGFQAWAGGLALLLAAWAPRPHRPAISSIGWAALLVLVLAAGVRFYRVESMPFAIHFDELNALAALEAMRTGTAENLFSRIDFYSTGNPGLALALQWCLGPFTANWFSASRWSAAIFGVASIAATYALGRTIAGPTVGLAASVALAASSWHLIASRFSQSLGAAAGAALAWWLLLRACATRRVFDAVLAGVAGGLALELYDPVKILLVTVPAWWLWHVLATRGFLRQSGGVMLIASAVALMVLAPLLRTAGWEMFFGRIQQVTLAGEGFRAALGHQYPSALSLATGQLQRLGRLASGGAEMAANHFIDTPLLNWIELNAALVGMLVCLTRWRQWRATVAPLWLAATVAAVTASSVPEASYRLAVALPAFAVLIGIGVCTPLQRLAGVLPWRIAPYAVATAALAVLAADLAINGERTVAYLLQYNRAPEFNTLGRAIAAGSQAPAYYVEVAPDGFRRPDLQALAQFHTVVNTPNVADQIPRVVDGQRAAVFVLPHWSRDRSLPFVLQTYPGATVQEQKDPSGFSAGHFVSVAAGIAPQPPPPCGLRRRACGNRAPAVDPFVVFLDLAGLCDQGGLDSAITWEGTIEVPAGPEREIGVSQNSVTTSLWIDGHALLSDDRRDGELAGRARVAPGRHAIRLQSKPGKGLPMTVALWWRVPGTGGEIVPCTAMMPAP